MARRAQAGDSETLWKGDGIMSDPIVVSIIGGACTALASIVSVALSSRLTNYKIQQLEKKVEKHNQLVERMAIVEQSTKSAHHRLDEYIGKEK